jgi:hypothetical protein
MKSAAVWMSDFVKNNPKVAQFAGYVLAGVAAFKALSIGILLVKASSLATSAALTVLKVAVMSNPVTAAVIAIGTAAYLLYENFAQVRSLFNGFWDGLMVGLSPVIKLFDGVGGKLSDIIEKVTGVKVATDEGSLSWQIWGENAGIAIGSVASDITDLLGKWYAFVYFKLDDRAKDYQEWINKIKAVFSGFFDWLDEKFKAISSFLIDANNDLNAILPESMQAHIESIKPIASPDLISKVSENSASQLRGGDVIHFSPNITLPAGTSEQTVTSVKQALTISQTEFEQRYKQMQRNNQRLNFATGQ